jgi:hypothetical protein
MLQLAAIDPPTLKETVDPVPLAHGARGREPERIHGEHGTLLARRSGRLHFVAHHPGAPNA